MKRVLCIILIISLTIGTLMQKPDIANASQQAPFNLKNQMSEDGLGAKYFFSGTVISVTNFEDSWIDDNGEPWGPFSRTLVEVKITKEYYGNTLVENDTIKILFTHRILSAPLIVDPLVPTIRYAEPFYMKVGSEYVFLSRLIDEKFIENRVPESKSYPEKYADTIIYDLGYNVFPVENENVLVYSEYFKNDKEVMKKTLSRDILIDSKEYTQSFVILKRTDFDQAFINLINTYTRKTPKTSKPNSKAIPKSKSVKMGAKIKLKAPKNTILYYTINGKTPTNKLKKTKIRAGRSKTIKIKKKIVLRVMAQKSGYAPSSVVKRVYKVRKK